MLEYGLKPCRLQRILATTAPENLVSQRVVEKAGMVFEGEEIGSNGLSALVYSIENDALEQL